MEGASAVSAAVAGVALAYLLYTFIFSKKQSLRGPPSSPLLENTAEVNSNLTRLLDWLLDGSLLYGRNGGRGTWTFKIMLQPRYVVSHDPDVVRHVLTNVDTYGKGPVWRMNFYALLGDGIFSADGQSWLMQRKRASHMFKVANFKTSMLTSVKTKLGKMMAQLKELAAEGKNGEAVVDMQSYFFRLTLDIIGEIAFGQDLGSLSGNNTEFMRAFDFCQQYANDLFFKPGPCWMWNWLTPTGWEFQRSGRVLDDYGDKLIRRIIQDVQHGGRTHVESKEEPSEPSEKETIVSFFLSQTSPEALRDPRSLRMLKEVAMNFQIAGRDTVAQAFSWAVWLLCLHPDVQQRVREEAQNKLGADMRLEDVSYEMVQKLEYTHCVVTEVLRLYPSVPKEGKWCYKDDVLPDGSRVLKHQWFIFSPYVMGRLESLWGPNATEFDPSRHLGQPNPSNFTFTAFQAGPRLCLGKNLAYMQLQLGLALLVLTFDMALEPECKPVEPVQNSTTLPMRDGVQVKLTLRSAVQS